MTDILRASERGRSSFGWLDSRHTFSFGRYVDPARMGFRSLRVLNDDRVEPGAGFGAHPHRDMEILSWVLEGAMEHEDSMGNGAVMRPGELQRMTAGTGVTHSEFNHSKTEPLHFLQVWVLPEREGLEPGYEQRAFPLDERRGELLLIASRDGRDGSVTVHQDVTVRAGRLGRGDRTEYALASGRHAWLHIARGEVLLDGEELAEGDGASTSGEERIVIEGRGDAEVLIFDLA